MAVAVKVSKLPSLTVLLPIAASTGATLTSLTVMVIVSKSLSAGEPLSVTRTVTLYVPSTLALGRGPTEDAGRRVDRRSGRSTGVQTERAGVGRQVGVGRGRRET